MGWFVSIGILIAGLILKSDAMIIAGGLFGIAGAISFAAITLKNDKKNNKE